MSWKPFSFQKPISKPHTLKVAVLFILTLLLCSHNIINAAAVDSWDSQPGFTALPLQSASDVIIYASEATTKVGNWQVVTDATAAGGARIWNPDAGAAKVVTPLANPPSYFEMTFSAQSGVAYHLWMRGKAQSDSPYNDSVHVQFSDS